jgi:hypothetical protein
MVAAGNVRSRAVRRCLLELSKAGMFFIVLRGSWLLVLCAVVAFGRGVVMMSLVGVRSVFEYLELCIFLGDVWFVLWR